MSNKELPLFSRGSQTDDASNGAYEGPDTGGNRVKEINSEATPCQHGIRDEEHRSNEVSDDNTQTSERF